jgi:hypothetical protein
LGRLSSRRNLGWPNKLFGLPNSLAWPHCGPQCRPLACGARTLNGVSGRCHRPGQAQAIWVHQ